METAPRLLVVEDDRETVELLVEFLAGRHLEVEVAMDEVTALALAREAREGRPFDLITLDVMLPGRAPGADRAAGFRIAETLRREGDQTHILFLTALDQVEHVKRGLANGDAYLTKPFSLEVLGAQVDALLRRIHPPGGAGRRLAAGPLALDQVTGELYFAERKLAALTPTESAVLRCLMQRPGTPVTVDAVNDQLYELAGGRDARELAPEALRKYVLSIRQKLGPARNLLRNVYGLGYFLDVQ